MLRRLFGNGALTVVDRPLSLRRSDPVQGDGIVDAAHDPHSDLLDLDAALGRGRSHGFSEEDLAGHGGGGDA